MRVSQFTKYLHTHYLMQSSHRLCIISVLPNQKQSGMSDAGLPGMGTRLLGGRLGVHASGPVPDTAQPKEWGILV